MPWTRANNAAFGERIGKSLEQLAATGFGVTLPHQAGRRERPQFSALLLTK